MKAVIAVSCLFGLRCLFVCCLFGFNVAFNNTNNIPISIANLLADLRFLNTFSLGSLMLVA